MVCSRSGRLVVVLVGAVGAVALVLRAGQSTDQPLLVILMTGWVFAPFAALILAHMRATRWSGPTRSALSWLMLVLTLGPLAVYVVDAFGPPTTALYVGVPMASFLLIALVLPATAFISGRRSRHVE